MIFLIIVILICIILMVILPLYKFIGFFVFSIFYTKLYKHLKMKKFNRVLDYQHTKMLKSIDNLKEDMIEHCVEESKIYKNALSKGKYQNKYTPAEWKKHTDAHGTVIQSIDSLKNKLLNHINTMDEKAFGWMNE